MSVGEKNGASGCGCDSTGAAEVLAAPMRAAMAGEEDVPKRETK